MTKKLFALLTVLPVATFGAAGLALADDTGNTYVGNWNYAEVSNIVVTSASTGGNSADGGNGGSAGDGGSVLSSDDDNIGGNGGNGGTGGNGGSVTTGGATAVSDVWNDVNRNDTEINRCACDNGDTTGDDTVENWNGAGLGNIVVTGAGSGDNNTDGGTGGDAGNGGDVVDSDDTNTGGNGGNGNAGGNGGSVTTGISGAVTLVTNYINTNITRILR